MQQYFSSSTAPSQLTRPVDAAAEQRGGQAQSEHRSRDQSALSLLQSQFEQLPIVTFCASIDQLLGGGVALGSMTEIVGCPGIGKTQMAMQLAADTTIPVAYGGVEGSALIIDTEGSVVPPRVKAVASAVVEHVQRQHVAKTGVRLETYELSDVLDRIFVIRTPSLASLLATLGALPQTIAKLKAKLVVVDSIALFFRQTFSASLDRHRALTTAAKQMQSTIEKTGVAIVVINQITMRQRSGTGTAVPALGESWSHIPATRVMLAWREHHRVAELIKSNNRPPGLVEFAVTKSGIRDAPKPDAKRKRDAAE